MSRGQRETVIGNISSSMRDNYGEYGVTEYYKKVGSTYRNPHFPGIRLCMFAWLNRWWTMEHENPSNRQQHEVLLFDMACGRDQSGEVTITFKEWFMTGKKLYEQLDDHRQPSETLPSRRRKETFALIGPDFPPPLIIAADPFTAIAYQDRTALPCASLSFQEITEGELPPIVSHISRPSDPPLPQDANQNGSYATIEMVVCSFALHLVENPSALFALLQTLSYRARWLVVLAPHKKPEIKDGWGWVKWDINEWKSISMSNLHGEILFERVHCRIYRSVNL